MHVERNGWTDRWMGYLYDTISVEGSTFMVIQRCRQQNILWPSPDFQQIFIFVTDFHKSHQYKISWRSAVGAILTCAD